MDVFQENLIDVKTDHFQEKVAFEILELSWQGLSFPWMISMSVSSGAVMGCHGGHSLCRHYSSHAERHNKGDNL